MTLERKTEKELETWYEQFHQDHDSLKKDLAAKHSLEVAYGQFTENHDKLKQELLASVPDNATSTSPPATAPAFPNFAKWALQVAACLLALAGIFSVPWLLSKPAYALEDVFAQVSSARSVYFGGYSRSLNDPNVKIPLEFYAKKPNTFWSTLYHTLRTDGGTYVETGYRASDGNILQQASNEPSDGALITTFARRDLPVWANIELTDKLSKTVGTEVFFSSTEGFEYVGRERFEDVRCDVYERISGSARQLLYVDPRRREPVGAAAYPIDRPNDVLWFINRVVINPIVPPAHMQLRVADGPVEELPTASARFTRDSHFTTKELLVPFALHVGNATLVCWADPHGVTQEPPKFELVTSTGDELKAAVRDIGQTNDGNVNWNWVRLTPVDPNLQSLPSVRVTDNYSRTIHPLKLGVRDVVSAISAMSSGQLLSDVKGILESVEISAAAHASAPQF